ncbi:hypothetical protein Glove_326g25 [Diversispora epigaea]|uniref:G-protein coupled receptors family 1 profile domain-containing protein n=1 Tax=Diversispora epigaea TaxID=1348612 RepID=A0A397HLZ1_9GLOM|nr:hypothetical protein Glove_326g25 [Diversispora epigaea]
MDQNQNEQCLWWKPHAECQRKDAYNVVGYVGIALMLLDFGLFLSTLIWRYFKKRSDYYWTHLEIALTCLLFFCTFRVILILNAQGVFNAFPIFFDILSSLSWWFGKMSVYIYISQIFTIIPHLSSNPSNHSANSPWIPTKIQINIFFWFILSFSFVVIFLTSFIGSYHFHYKNDKNVMNLSFEIMFVVFWINDLIMASAVTYYGKLLSKLLDQSTTLAGNEIELRKIKRQFKVQLQNMRTTNYFLGTILWLYVIILVPSSIISSSVFLLNYTSAILNTFAAPALVLIIGISVIYNESSISLQNYILNTETNESVNLFS